MMDSVILHDIIVMYVCIMKPKGYFFYMDGKRRIRIVSCLDCTQIYMRESEECEHNTSLRKDSNGVV